MDCRNSSLLLPEKIKQLESASQNIKRNICVTLGTKNVLSGIPLSLFIAVIAKYCHSVEDEKESTHRLKTLKILQTTVKIVESFDQF